MVHAAALESKMPGTVNETAKELVTFGRNFDAVPIPDDIVEYPRLPKPFSQGHIPPFPEIAYCQLYSFELILCVVV